MLNPPQDDEPSGSGSRRTVAVTVLAVVVVAVVAVVAVVITGRGSSSSTAAPGSTVAAPPSTSAASTSTSAAPTGTTVAVRSSTVAAAGACAFAVSGTAARPATVPAATAPATGTFTGQLSTSAGPVPLTLDRAKAPCTVASVVSLATQSFYDDAPCSRLTSATLFVLQCGDPTGTGTGGPGYTVPDELPTTPSPTGIYYPRGTIAMANAGAPNTGGSQFFLVYRDSPLPPTYTVFGTIAPAGLVTLDAIAARGTANGTGDGPPATQVKILALSGS